MNANRARIRPTIVIAISIVSRSRISPTSMTFGAWRRAARRPTAKALKSLRGIYIDCGSRDQYHIHYGTRTLSKRLAEAGIRHRYEEFEDNHSDVDYRMDVSLPFLAKALR